LLNGTIRHHLGKYVTDYKEFVLKFLTDLYVDDTTTGCSNVGRCKEFFLSATKILEEGGFELRKWVSNDSDLQRFFDNAIASEPEVGDDITFSQSQLGTSNSGLKKVLGVD